MYEKKLLLYFLFECSDEIQVPHTHTHHTPTHTHTYLLNTNARVFLECNLSVECNLAPASQLAG